MLDATLSGRLLNTLEWNAISDGSVTRMHSNYKYWIMLVINGWIYMKTEERRGLC